MKIILKFKKLLIVCLTIFVSFSNVFAVYENSNIDLGKYRIYYNKNENRYIKYNSTSQRFFDYYYIDNEGNRYPAYCINLGMDGAEKEEYDVNVSKELEDKTLMNIILNGYPYKTLSELSLNTEEEARFSTQFAAWVYVNNLDFSKMEPLNESGIRVINAIKQIYTNGVNGNILSNKINIKEIDKEFKIDEINKECYSKKYMLEYNENVKEIMLLSNSLDIKVCDLNNNIIDTITNQKEIKILVPRKNIINDDNITLSFKYKTKENAVMFGATTKANMQNVALALKPIKNIEENLNISIKYIPSILKIVKVDKDDNNIKIPNVKFKIYDKNSEKLLGEYVTDKNGEVVVDLQKDLDIFLDTDIIVEEVEVPDGYYIDKQNNKHIATLKVGEENKVIFENEKIHGNVKIIKTSNEDNLLSGKKKGSPIEDTVFNILDENGNVVDTVVTNSDGIAYSKMLPKGKYFIKEIKSNKYYVLKQDKIEFEINLPNQEIIINVENDNINYIEELPYTGRFV